MFEYERTAERLTLCRPGTRWLSNGIDGGSARAATAHNLTVPAGFDRTDLEAYVAERFEGPPAGPTLLTGVSQTHARGARYGPAEAVATAGVSNPATLPVDGTGGLDATDGVSKADRRQGDRPDPGTVNVFVGTDRALSEAGRVELLATAVEAKTATLLGTVGCTGTTSDAIAVGSAVDGAPAEFAGSATELGNAARVCVRDAVRSALAARYEEGPPAPTEATHGTETAGSASTFEP
ncbi:adenosylcobinamide amidohydrolase [Natronomonas sp.]|uniref:adenosylcobinamide amidohydrolase n=1 Tax=Natronomonas sp. TaxID=2184060 RepID=UPI002618972F|nr:adenosylcobinamide amidohydrolase [Natronomonas sp.]